MLTGDLEGEDDWGWLTSREVPTYVVELLLVGTWMSWCGVLIDQPVDSIVSCGTIVVFGTDVEAMSRVSILEMRGGALESTL